MARILSTATAFPAHEVTQDEMLRVMAEWLGDRTEDAGKVLRIVSRAGVERRFSILPVEQLFAPAEFGDRNRNYVRHGIDLAMRASQDALRNAGVDPRAVDLVTTVSCTGFMIPSVDAHLANRLPLNDAIRRLPITELGCAAGAMALSHTADYLRGRPTECALVVSVELPSLNIQPEDLSMDHLVSCALFGDGAAAVLVAGEESALVTENALRAATAPRIVERDTWFLHDTIDTMGFRVEGSGFHMILDVGIPELLERELPRAIARLLRRANVELEDVEHFLVHPGGRRILDVAERWLDRGPRALRRSRELLARCGNLSSASILALLHEFESAGVAKPGERAVLIAFGPGFNAESILLEWPNEAGAAC